MTISFEGRTMAEIQAEMEAFLHGDGAIHCKATPEQAAELIKAWDEAKYEPVKVVPPFDMPEQAYTAADIRKAFGDLARKGVSRDEIRSAMTSISGASSVSDIPEEKFPAMMAWCKEHGA